MASRELRFLGGGLEDSVSERTGKVVSCRMVFIIILQLFRRDGSAEIKSEGVEHVILGRRKRRRLRNFRTGELYVAKCRHGVLCRRADACVC